MIRSKYLIIGNSTAGVAAIEAIRDVDRKGTIAVVSDEEIFNYSKPLISYFLDGQFTPAGWPSAPLSSTKPTVLSPGSEQKWPG